MVRHPLFLLVLAPLAACGSSGSTPAPVSGSTAPFVVEANPQPALGTLSPIDAPDNTWTWVPVADAHCGNGSSTGFAVNLMKNSNQLLLVYEGGGACADNLTCYGLKTASYMDGYDQTTFETEAIERPLLESDVFVTNRQDPNNPFATANIAYFPYCTGDIHDGNNVVTYAGASQSTHHVGFRNGQIFTKMVQATLPNITHVWVSGYSAGGFGATFHYDDTQDTFPNARVDLINDSGSAFPGQAEYDSWAMQRPSHCPTCDMNNFATFIASYSAANTQSRIGILSYSADTVLPQFFGITTQEFSTELATYEATLDTLPNAKYFVVSGSGHVLLDNNTLTAGGEKITTWIQQMVSDDPSWASYK